jgi:hypothetical protein
MGDELFAKILKKSHHGGQVIAHSSRYTDLTAPDQSFEPGGNVYAIAEDIALVDSRSRPLQLVCFSTAAGPTHAVILHYSSIV